MTDNLETNSPEQQKSKLPIIIFAILGLALAGYCIFGALFLLKPRELSNIDDYTPTPTPLPISTSAPATVTNDEQTIQILATSSASQWPMLFSDTFDTDQENWTVSNVESEEYDGTLEIKEGKYSWSITSKKEFFMNTYPSLAPVTNFHLSADLKLTSGSYKPIYGVTFRENPAGDFYYFGIYGDGFVVDVFYNQAWSRIIETKSSAILPEETNRLTVIAEASHFVFFINDQYVFEMTDDRIKEGLAGFGLAFFHAGLQNTFDFDNFVLRTP